MGKKTPLYEKHVTLGARIVPFAGFDMPVYYTSILEEVLLVRRRVGVFDVSHMGEIEVTGKDALEFVNYITTNNVFLLDEYQVQYSTMLYPHGGIVDDLLVYRLPDKVLLVVNAANTDKDFKWIVENKKGDVEIRNRSEEYFQLAIQGPPAEKVMQRIVDKDLSELPFYWSTFVEIEGKEFLLSRTGYTGEDGFEIYGEAELGKRVWDIVFEAGEDEGIGPAGLGARDTLRLEMKYCLYGNDIDETTTPLEAGLSWVVKMDKGEFIGRDALIKQKEDGIKRKLVCIELEGRNIARHGYKILKGGEEVGYITSGNWSPSVEKSIALGYVNVPHHKSGTEIEVDIRGRSVRGVIVKPPFYKNATHK